METVVFGKLPTEGDFVRAGADRELLNLLDRWLTAAWADFVVSADPKWEERYRVSPLWWFAVPQGGATICGVISPSLDSVGRLFPVVVATRLDVTDAASAIRLAAPWLAMVQGALLTALEPPGQSVNDLLVAAGAGHIEPSQDRVGRVVGHAGLQTLVALEQDIGWAAELAGPAVALGQNWSLWQAAAFEGVASRAVYIDGWPGALAIGQLLAMDLDRLSRWRGIALPVVEEQAIFRVEASELLQVQCQGQWTPVPGRPLMIQGSRGVAICLSKGTEEGPAFNELAVALRDMLSGVPRSGAHFWEAANILSHVAGAAVVVAKLNVGWAVATTGSELALTVKSGDVVWSDRRNNAEAGGLSVRLWRDRSPGAIEVDWFNEPESGSPKPFGGSLLGFRKGPHSTRLAMIEPA